MLVFRIDTGGGNLKLVQTVPTDGDTTILESAPPILVTLSGASFVYVINSLATGIDAYSLASNGTLTAVSGSPFLIPQGTLGNPQLVSLMAGPGSKFLFSLDISGVILQNQIDPSTGALTIGPASPSGGFAPWASVMDPTGSSIYASEPYAVISSFGIDAGISGFSVNSASGQLAVMPSSPFQLGNGIQPSGIVIDPAGRFVYTALTNADTIAAFSRDSASGALTQVAGSPFRTARANSETYYLVVHPSGKFLYALNLNGYDISGYSINSTSGALAPLPGSPFPAQNTPDVFKQPFTQGPMTIDASGKFLYVVTSEAYIAVYKIDLTSGSLSISGSPRSIPEPALSVNVFSVN